ncbi:APC family permease [Nitratifractor salsuginis]|uniref:Amino acid permease-associated region n=1 Tax=Nitratifractor salsuginis (strain DSM 16511 / JCM 12458 / E9I37-1) TaxID=749222 RepID=E6X3F6_NITSE|nr:APC family permease [Nitratifractor salsuginis]ADV46233.1 amino acid permease-associated region [Nitratifractor salsuginis DSM 16511]
MGGSGKEKKAFGLWSAIFIGIGSMVGAGIFIVIGEAGAIAGNIVWLSFIFGGIAALLSGYSLAKLALRYPSRGGIVEYLVQGYGEGVFSGSASVLFYFAGLVAIAAVAKSFGTYAATFLHAQNTPSIVNAFALGIVGFFLLINLIGATFVAKSENLLVIIKVTILTVFAVAAAWHIDPALLSAKKMPPIMNMLYAIGLTFFAYQGFSVITNTVEDMENPARNMMRAMIGAILIVMALYVLTAVAVLGNLPLPEVIKAKDYTLAEAAKPVFGVLGFKVMAATALLSTASAINASLYATAEISYTMAKEGNLPKVYSYNVFQSNEGLIISSLLIVPMILFFDLSEVTTVAALSVLIVQGLTHIGHLMRLKETGANGVLVFLAAAAMFTITALTLHYTRLHDPAIGYYLLGAFVLCFLVEVSLRIFTKRIVTRQVVDLFNFKRWEDEKKI